MKLTAATFLTAILLAGCSPNTGEQPEEPTVPEELSPIAIEEELSDSSASAEASADAKPARPAGGAMADKTTDKKDSEELVVLEVIEEEPVVEPEPKSVARTIMLHASNWQFSPSLITVKKGEDISLHLMGMEGGHGFAIPELGINETMGQGEMKMVKIPTDTSGVYNFFCNIVCGPGHADMEGTLIIEE